MIKRSKRLLIFFTGLCLMALSFVSNAADWDNKGVTTKILAVTTLQNGLFYIDTADDICDDNGVINKVGYVYNDETPGGIPSTPEGINHLLSTALLAQASGQDVVVYADNSEGRWGCKMGALKVK